MLKQQIEKKDEENKSLKANIGWLEKLMVQKCEEIKAYEQRLDWSRGEVMKRNAWLDALDNTCANAEKESATWHSRYMELQKKYEALQTSERGLAQECYYLQTCNAGLKADLEGEKSKSVSIMELLVVQAKNNQEELEKVRLECSQKLQSGKKESEVRNRELNDWKEAYERCKAELQLKVLKLGELRKKNDELTGEIEELRNLEDGEIPDKFIKKKQNYDKQ